MVAFQERRTLCSASALKSRRIVRFMRSLKYPVHRPYVRLGVVVTVSASDHLCSKSSLSKASASFGCTRSMNGFRTLGCGWLERVCTTAERLNAPSVAPNTGGLVMYPTRRCSRWSRHKRRMPLRPVAA